MRKIIFALVALIVAAPAFGDGLGVTATQVGSTLDVDIDYNAPGKLPRGFGLDITVDSGQAITDISNFIIGECTSSGKGFGIFPANFARYIDPADPNTWDDANYTPVADPCDLPGDTQPGLGYSGITIEMGSLYTGPNSPPASGTLCTITVSGGCTVSLAANVGRGKVVFEDGTEPAPLNLTGCTVVTQVEVPDVVGLAQAAAVAAIEAEGLVAASTTTYTDCSQDAGNVTSQDPTGGTPVDPDSTVDIWVRGVCDGDLTCDAWVNSMDVSNIVLYIDTYGFWGAVARGSADWDEKYNFETAGDQNDYINSQDVSKLVNYIDTEGFWGSVECPGPGMP